MLSLVVEAGSQSSKRHFLNPAAALQYLLTGRAEDEVRTSSGRGWQLTWKMCVQVTCRHHTTYPTSPILPPPYYTHGAHAHGRTAYYTPLAIVRRMRARGRAVQPAHMPTARFTILLPPSFSNCAGSHRQCVRAAQGLQRGAVSCPELPTACPPGLHQQRGCVKELAGEGPGQVRAHVCVCV